MENSRASSRLEKLSSFVRKWCSYFLLQYELITCTCMFEPWEKVFINGLIFLLFGLVAYSSWVYLPQYLVSLFSYLNRITGAVTYNYGHISTDL